MFVIQDRIGIGDRGCHQRACVVRRARHDDFQSGGPIEPRFGVLRVIRSRVPQSAPRHPHDHRNAAAPSVPDFGGVVDELIEPGCDEVVELDLANRPLPGERGADADAEHGALGERRVDDAVAKFFQ